jgi:uncharacterized Fe-S cluster-containing radical SAM superfamily protein
MPEFASLADQALDARKFRDPTVTAAGDRRAVVVLTRLRTLWFNTGSLCNITCRNCYMESSPTNDALAYLAPADVRRFVDEVARLGLPVEEIGFTGGEPFMNRRLIDMLELCLERGFGTLVLTNAMKPMHNRRAALAELRRRFGGTLRLRVSVDHHSAEGHQAVRGPGTWAPMLEGLGWLAAQGFALSVAGRTCWTESETEARRGYAELFARHHIPVDAEDTASLVLFPEMDAATDVPEITMSCWDILGVPPETVMCASSRMVVKRREAGHAVVVPCTLLPYDPPFELGADLDGAAKVVSLNHPHCAKFCVLGGASCAPS